MADPDLAKQFSAKMLGIYTGAVLTKLVDIGYQTGLFESSKLGPASSEELSERAGLKERYVREWLGAMTTGGIYTYDALTQRYTLPEDHARALTGEGAANLSPTSRLINHFGTHLPALTRCFRAGGGISYSAYRPCSPSAWTIHGDVSLTSTWCRASSVRFRSSPSRCAKASPCSTSAAARVTP
jgi:hypothetical protein